ncbi:ADP-ribosylglycohydrolase [Patellaria atrata CBS 101060]|uniref:ADP-ribosylglycohydrolase n=1 Tax=Patellaria atrata CBS 101060 TaxID=1346257 RepID=A0A9P4S745_9PEZI|nr:ADP-ribosylglycohydrolase [Patellaria atrata CBS 101060]
MPDQPTHPFINVTTHSKILGTFLGSALGDTIGLYTEFLPRTECLRSYPPGMFSLTEPNITPFRADTHRDKFDEGSWTDDTDQSILLLLSFLHQSIKKNAHNPSQPSPDPRDIAHRLRIWITQGLRALERPPLGIGRTTSLTVCHPSYLDDPAARALQVWVNGNRDVAANGSVMRTHPLGVICLNSSLEETFRAATEVGRITHVDPRCVVACCLVTGLIRGMLRGEVTEEEHLDEMIQTAYEWVASKPELCDPDGGMEASTSTEPRLKLDEYRAHCHAKSFADLKLDEAQKIGYVYKALGAGVLCLRLAMRRKPLVSTSTHGEVFETLVTELIMEGGDADTNACVAGALLGAWLGYEELPQAWVKGMKDVKWLVRKTERASVRLGVLCDPTAQDEAEDEKPDGGKPEMSKSETDEMEKAVLTKILEKQQKRREDEERAKSRKGALFRLFK